MCKSTLPLQSEDLMTFLNASSAAVPWPPLRRDRPSAGLHAAIVFLTKIVTLTCLAVNAAWAGAVPTEMEGLLNFHEVHPYLYRGGGPDQQALHNLKDKGVKTIIDLRAPSEGAKAEKKSAAALGLKYINLPMDSHAPTKTQVHIFIETVEKAQKGHSGPVYVHCAHGSDRTGCMVGIWRVTHEGWTYDKAYQEMRRYFFTPKFTALSSAVKQYSENASTHVAVDSSEKTLEPSP